MYVREVVAFGDFAKKWQSDLKMCPFIKKESTHFRSKCEKLF